VQGRGVLLDWLLESRAGVHAWVVCSGFNNYIRYCGFEW